MPLTMGDLHDLTRLPGYRNYTFVKDETLADQKLGEMIKGDKKIRVSPAMFELLKTDFEAMAKNLQVRVFTPPDKIKVSKRGDT